MRLKKEEVVGISKLIIDNLVKKNIIILKVDFNKVVEKTIDVFLDDIMLEDRLNKEVEEILKSYSYEIETGKIDYQKMFNMIKQKLIKERGLVI